MDHAQVQGLDFMNYRNEYAKVKENKHDLLGVSSSPEWGSIIEALGGTDSLSQQQKVINDEINGYEIRFNALLAEYTTAYTTYNSALLAGVSTRTDLQSMKAGLDAKYAQLVVLGQNINADIIQTQTLNGVLSSSMESKINRINVALNEQTTGSNENQGKIQDDINGQLEVTSLNMTAYYYHYIVYFLISVTLLSFLFNLMINPAATAMPAIYVCGALVVLFVISRWVVN